MNENEKFWLVGLLEGEGSFLKGPPSSPKMAQVTISMTDKDIIEKVSNLLGANYYTSNRGKDKGWKTTYIVTVRGKTAVNLMNEIKPLMGERRKQQIEKAISCWSPKKLKVTFEQAENIREAYKYGASTKDLGKEYGVTHWYIYHILKGKVLNGPVA